MHLKPKVDVRMPYYFNVLSAWMGGCGVVSGCGYVVVSGGVSRHIQVCIRSYHLDEILY